MSYTLDLCDHDDLDLDGVLKAIRDATISREYPAGLVISSEQEAAFLAEWSAANVSEPAPEALDGKSLWGQPVQVR